MGRAPCCEKVGLKRGPWTSCEDMRLILHIKKHGEGAWRTLPKEAGLLRCGKSCRLRWLNYLRPNIKKGNISKDEESLIIKLHSILGNRWSLIASKLPGRTDNEIKNHWNAHLKKRLYALGIDPKTHKPFPRSNGFDREIKRNARCNLEICVCSKANVFESSLRHPKIIILGKGMSEFENNYATQNHETCLLMHSNMINGGNIAMNCLDNSQTQECINNIEMPLQKIESKLEISEVGCNDHGLLSRSLHCTTFPRLLEGVHEVQTGEWTSTFPIMSSIDPSSYSTWGILENDFIWDQIDMLHGLEGDALVISSSPCNVENSITQLDDLWGSCP